MVNTDVTRPILSVVDDLALPTVFIVSLPPPAIAFPGLFVLAAL